MPPVLLETLDSASVPDTPSSYRPNADPEPSYNPPVLPASERVENSFLEKSGKCFVDPALVDKETAAMNDEDVVRAIESECADVTPSSLKNCAVPNIVHLMIGSRFNFKQHHYYSILSIYQRLKPDAIYVHTWGQILDEEGLFEAAKRQFDLKLVACRVVKRVFGNLVHAFEHKADVLRLETLIRFGGMYFDLDVLVTRPLDVFFSNDFTIGAQYFPSDDKRYNNGLPYGLCNGIMISKRCSPFSRKLYDMFKQFDNSDWDRLAVREPYEVYNEDTSLAHVDESLVNIWPPVYLYEEKYLDNENYTRIVKSSRAIHTYHRSLGVEYTPSQIRNGEFGFEWGRLMKELLDESSPVSD
ncbi:MAG: hypothetical protein SGCHY_004826 [Lobulomycetales sp.]